MPIFYQHPFDLENEERVKRLYDEMWFTGTGILKFIYERLRLGRGTYPLDSILATAKRSKRKLKQLQRVLTEFDLFIIENGMVSLRPGLHASDFIHRESLSRKAEKAAELSNQDYSDNLFPDDARQQDLAAAEKLNQEIREDNKIYFKAEY